MEEIKLVIIHRVTKESRVVAWAASIRGFVLVDWPLGVEMKFRCRTGHGVGNAKDWIITKAELAKLKNRIDE